MGTFANAAPELHARGLNCLPIIPGGAKAPARGCKWRVWQATRQTQAEVEELVRRYPRHEVAILLGVPGSHLVDLETDGPDGDRWLAESGLPLPKTAVYHSPRGTHRLYRTPSGPVRRSKPHPKVEIRGRGCLSIVPPSRGRVWAAPAYPEPQGAIPENLLPYCSYGQERYTGWATGTAPLPEEWRQFLVPDAGPARHTEGPKPPTSWVASEPGCPSLSKTSEGLLAALVGSDRRSGQIVLELCRQADVTQRLLAHAWERGVGIEQNFHCIFEGHEEDHPSCAIIWDPRSGTFVYHDRHRRSDHACFTLPEVAAVVQLKDVRKYRRADHPKNADESGGAFTAVICYVGALSKAGMVTPIENPLGTLPPGSPPEARAVHSGVGYLFGLRWLLSPGEPIPLSWRLLSRLCDLPEKFTALGMYHLRTNGLILPAGSYVAYGKPVSLWLPGRSANDLEVPDVDHDSVRPV